MSAIGPSGRPSRRHELRRKREEKQRSENEAELEIAKLEADLRDAWTAVMRPTWDAQSESAVRNLGKLLADNNQLPLLGGLLELAERTIEYPGWPNYRKIQTSQYSNGDPDGSLAADELDRLASCAAVLIRACQGQDDLLGEEDVKFLSKRGWESLRYEWSRLSTENTRWNYLQNWLELKSKLLEIANDLELNPQRARKLITTHFYGQNSVLVSIINGPHPEQITKLAADLLSALGAPWNVNHVPENKDPNKRKRVTAAEAAAIIRRLLVQIQQPDESNAQQGDKKKRPRTQSEGRPPIPTAFSDLAKKVRRRLSTAPTGKNWWQDCIEPFQAEILDLWQRNFPAVVPPLKTWVFGIERSKHQRDDGGRVVIELVSFDPVLRVHQRLQIVEYHELGPTTVPQDAAAKDQALHELEKLIEFAESIDREGENGTLPEASQEVEEPAESAESQGLDQQTESERHSGSNSTEQIEQQVSGQVSLERARLTATERKAYFACRAAENAAGRELTPEQCYNAISELPDEVTNGYEPTSVDALERADRRARKKLGELRKDTRSGVATRSVKPMSEL